MRILHVISSANPQGGGPIEAVRQYAKAHIAMGHQVEVACCDPADADWLKDFECPINAFGPSTGTFGYAPELGRWLRRYGAKFDAVVVNGLWQYAGFATWRAMRRLKKPYVVFTHGMLDPWFKETYPLKHLKKSLYWPGAEFRILKNAKWVLFTCEEERLLARQSFRMYRAREKVVNFGTSAPVGDPSKQKLAFLAKFPELEGCRILLFLSRIHPKKGVDILIRAFAANCANDPSLRLAIAGPDQVGLRPELEKLAASLRVGNRIVWTGPLDGDVKWGAYRSCEAFVLPSHQENFGIVVAEAMACEKPVLISNKVNIWREIEIDGAGLIADDTVKGTAANLATWLAFTNEQKEEMGRKARECFVARFEVDAAAQSLLAALSEGH